MVPFFCFKNTYEHSIAIEHIAGQWFVNNELCVYVFTI